MIEEQVRFLIASRLNRISFGIQLRIKGEHDFVGQSACPFLAPFDKIEKDWLGIRDSRDTLSPEAQPIAVGLLSDHVIWSLSGPPDVLALKKIGLPGDRHPFCYITGLQTSVI